MRQPCKETGVDQNKFQKSKLQTKRRLNLAYDNFKPMRQPRRGRDGRELPEARETCRQRRSCWRTQPPWSGHVGSVSSTESTIAKGRKQALVPWLRHPPRGRPKAKRRMMSKHTVKIGPTGSQRRKIQRRATYSSNLQLTVLPYRQKYNEPKREHTHTLRKPAPTTRRQAVPSRARVLMSKRSASDRQIDV